mgnify:CR=1 FL=1
MTIAFTNIPSEDPQADTFIDDEILVDTYGEEEQLSAWYTYLEDELPFPFQGVVRTEKVGNSIRYSQVSLESLAPVARCGLHQMWVMGRLSIDKTLVHFFLADLKSVDTMEAFQPIYYWKYWSQHR